MQGEQTKIEKIAKRASEGTLDHPNWVEEYNKDGIVIFSEDVFGTVKLTVNGVSGADRRMAAVAGIVAFSDYCAGGIGRIIPYVPYVRKKS